MIKRGPKGLALKVLKNETIVALSAKPRRGVHCHAAASAKRAINSPMKQRAFSRSGGIEKSEEACLMCCLLSFAGMCRESLVS
jgi:hypothetical protein